MTHSNLTPVSSSNLDALGYDDTDSTMYAQFKGGAVYAYQGVPKDIYELVLNANSVGRALNEHVKNVYNYVRVS